MYKKKIQNKKTDIHGNQCTEVTYKSVLFKDKANINHRSEDDYLSNIWELAAAVRTNNSDIYFDSRFMNGEQKHYPKHAECDYSSEDNKRETEKRICRCMNYYDDTSSKCKSCNLIRKWKNVGEQYHVIDYEVPTDYVVSTVGGIDLLLECLDGTKYAVELKPENSKETLVRMMAEIITVNSYKNENYEPAICIFKDSLQWKDFLNPVIQQDTAFQYLLSKIIVFYITYEQHADIVQYVIHNYKDESII